MNTNKKVVRLSESKLRNVIAESVKQVLSELDWKTKYNAGKKELDLFDKFLEGGYTNKTLKDSNEFSDSEKKRLKRRGKELGGLGYVEYGDDYLKDSPFFRDAEDDFNAQFGDEFKDGDVTYRVRGKFGRFNNNVYAYRDAPNEEWEEEYVDPNNGTIETEKRIGRYDIYPHWDYWDKDNGIRQTFNRDASGRLKKSYERAKREFDKLH